MIGGDRDVAAHVEHMASTDRVPVDRREHRLGDVSDQAVEGLDLKDASLALSVVARLRTLLLVAAGAERTLARTGEGEHAD